MKPLLLPALALLLLTQCQKADSGPAKPEDQLPAATQTGQHTFGCLLNGQPWTPGGNVGPLNYRLIYDPGYAGGDLEIRAYRYIDALKGTQYFIISGAPVTKTGTYLIDGKTIGVYYKSGVKGSCYEYYNDPKLTVHGQLIVSRLDLTPSIGIMSGTFNFKLYQPGCDTINVTQGRFDYKL
ncbi:MAG: hypothetical protein EOO36_07240 [Cytophagaceae bacterium]|nr:MAG: hypothetical protein EOO36_07240 [Cytophagaceae bacterium]